MFNDVEVGRSAQVFVSALPLYGLGGSGTLSCSRPRGSDGALGAPKLALNLDLFRRGNPSMRIASWVSRLSYRIDDGEIVHLDVSDVDLKQSPLEHGFALRMMAIMRQGGLLRVRLLDRRANIVNTVAYDIRGFADVHDWVAQAGCHVLLPTEP